MENAMDYTEICSKSIPLVSFDGNSLSAELNRLQEVVEKKKVLPHIPASTESTERILMERSKRQIQKETYLQKTRDELLQAVHSLDGKSDEQRNSQTEYILALRQQLETIANEKNTITVRATALQHRASLLEKRVGMY